MHLAEAVRAAGAAANDFERWALAVTGAETMLPEDMLDAAMDRAFGGLPVITMEEALRGMH